MRKMNLLISSILATFVIQCMMLILIPQEKSSMPSKCNTTTKFVDCLTKQSSITKPISNAILYTPQNPSYTFVLQSYVRNLRFNKTTTPKPLVIITPIHKSHVQATIVCAKASDLELRIRSGGHDYEGLSYVSPNPFVILDMYNLRRVDVDLASDTAWVESGATIGEVYYKIASMSNVHAFPAGVCPSVGIGGHFSGGGYGNLLRKFGLTVDNVIDAEIVDAKGRILDRESMGEDLFWAIRGGGAASFCVVIAWKINLVRVPEIVTTFLVRKTLEEGVTNIVYEWQHVAPKTDPNLFIRAQSEVIRGKKGKKTVQVSFFALYLGRASTLVGILNKDFPLLGLNQTDCKEQRWVESNILFNELPMDTSLEFLLQRTPNYVLTHEKHKSDYVKQPISKQSLGKIWEKLIEHENISLQFNPYGGKMSQIPENATPFPHRKGTLYKIQYLLYWEEVSVETTVQKLESMKLVHDFMSPYVSSSPREAYLNYRDIDVGSNDNYKSFDFALGFFKGNLERLLMVKSMVDPNNFFRNEQSIPVISSVST